MICCRAKFCGKRSAAGNAAGESAPDASAADDQALGQLDAARRGVAEPGTGDGTGGVH